MTAVTGASTGVTLGSTPGMLGPMIPVRSVRTPIWILALATVGLAGPVYAQSDEDPPPAPAEPPDDVPLLPVAPGQGATSEGVDTVEPGGPEQEGAPTDASMTPDLALSLAAQADAERRRPTVGGELTFGGLGEDIFLTLNLRFNFDQNNWGIGIQAPLRIRVIDNDPDNDNDYGGLLRREDWDELSDYFRILRYVYLGQRDKRGPYYIRVGELSRLTIGHGTIMHRYYNEVDANRWRTGLNIAVNQPSFGVEGMVGNLANPNLVGVRGYYRPLDLFLGGAPSGGGEEGVDGPEQSAPDTPAPSGWGHRLVVGHSLFVDAKAPFELRFGARCSDGNPPDATGACLDAQAPRQVLLTDGNGYPRVAEDKPLMVIGLFDIGYELIQTQPLKLTPYIDLNKITQLQNGWGLHIGALTQLDLPLAIDRLLVDLRTEYRYVSGDYLAPYFNSVYEIDRFERLGLGGQPTPKLRSLCGNAACDAGAPSGRNGWFFELTAGLPNFVLFDGEYIDYDGPNPDGQFRLSVEIPVLEQFQLSAYYFRVNVDGPGDLFAIDDKSAVVAQATVPVYSFLSLNLRMLRIWRANGDGGYEPVTDWSAGVGLNLEL